ncbi:MAG: sulfite reductase subunit alpha [Pseudomonadota bacterium]
MNTQPTHLLLAAITVAGYCVMCLKIWQRTLDRHRNAMRLATAQGKEGQTSLLVLHASQTGTAENIATQTATALQVAGVNAVLRSFAHLDVATLLSATQALFVVSTYGEGDAPDSAATFVTTVMRESAVDLSRLQYGMLTLGDRSYRNYCGFGRELDAWLQRQHAQPLFPPIEVNNGDPDAVNAWRRELGHIAATTDLPAWQDVPFEAWTLRARKQLNSGSLGAPIFHIELALQNTVTTGWQAGDLLQVHVPDDPDRPRDYSIASIPADGAVHLLVRLQIRTDGTIGGASRWLTSDLPVGATLRARLRTHSQFRIGDNAERDLILIGNGTGLAGLLAHLKQRELKHAVDASARRHWLLFGERQAACDALFGTELAAWFASGLLTRLDLVYSRDGGAERYVQDRLRAEGERLRMWVAAGAAIYVCGSLDGMAEGVASVLREQLGEDVLTRLQGEGRYRRDVY